MCFFSQSSHSKYASLIKKAKNAEEQKQIALTYFQKKISGGIIYYPVHHDDPLILRLRGKLKKLKKATSPDYHSAIELAYSQAITEATEIKPQLSVVAYLEFLCLTAADCIEPKLSSNDRLPGYK